MTRDEFSQRYRLVEQLTSGEVASHRALDSEGKPVMLHMFGGANRTTEAVASMLAHLRSGESLKVREVIEVEGSVVAVTEAIAPFTSFEAWITASGDQEAAPPGGEPAPADAHQPGPFRIIFRGLVPPDAPAVQPPDARPAVGQAGTPPVLPTAAPQDAETIVRPAPQLDAAPTQPEAQPEPVPPPPAPASSAPSTVGPPEPQPEVQAAAPPEAASDPPAPVRPATPSVSLPGAPLYVPAPTLPYPQPAPPLAPPTTAQPEVPSAPAPPESPSGPAPQEEPPVGEYTRRSAALDPGQPPGSSPAPPSSESVAVPSPPVIRWRSDELPGGPAAPSPGSPPDLGSRSDVGGKEPPPIPDPVIRWRQPASPAPGGLNVPPTAPSPPAPSMPDAYNLEGGPKDLRPRVPDPPGQVPSKPPPSGRPAGPPLPSPGTADPSSYTTVIEGFTPPTGSGPAAPAPPPPAQPVPARRPSLVPLVIGMVVVVAILAALVVFVVLRSAGGAAGTG